MEPSYQVLRGLRGKGLGWFHLEVRLHSLTPMTSSFQCSKKSYMALSCNCQEAGAWRWGEWSPAAMQAWPSSTPQAPASKLGVGLHGREAATFPSAPPAVATS